MNFMHEVGKDLELMTWAEEAFIEEAGNWVAKSILWY